MKKVNFRNIVLSFCLVIAVFGLVGCGKKDVEQKRESALDEKRVIKEDNNDPVDLEYKLKKVDTSDWRLYESEELGFKVKIPKNWSCEGEEMFGNLGRRCFENNIKFNEEGGSMMVYIPGDDPEEQKETDFRANVRNQRDEGYNVYFIRVDQEDGFIEKFPNLNRVVFCHNKKTWMITAKESPNETDSYIDGIIETFKFTK